MKDSERVLAKMLALDREATYVQLVSDHGTPPLPPLPLCLVCRRMIDKDEESSCATRQTDGGLVCPKCTKKVRKGNTDALRALAES